jgi:protein subunit release factor B
MNKSQSQKIEHFIIMLTWNVQNTETQKDGRKNNSCQDRNRDVEWRVTAGRHEFFGGSENILELSSGDHCTML